MPKAVEFSKKDNNWHGLADGITIGLDEVIFGGSLFTVGADGWYTDYLSANEAANALASGWVDDIQALIEGGVLTLEDVEKLIKKAKQEYFGEKEGKR